MKKIILTICLLAGLGTMATATPPTTNMLTIQSSVSEYPIVATANYNLNDPVFSFSYDFSQKIRNFNLPFASHFYISGNHLEFKILQEDFIFYFVRNNSKSYYDLQIDFGIDSVNIGVLRIYFQ